MISLDLVPLAQLLNEFSSSLTQSSFSGEAFGAIPLTVGSGLVTVGFEDSDEQDEAEVDENVELTERGRGCVPVVILDLNFEFSRAGLR